MADLPVSDDEMRGRLRDAFGRWEPKEGEVWSRGNAAAYSDMMFYAEELRAAGKFHIYEEELRRHRWAKRGAFVEDKADG